MLRVNGLLAIKKVNYDHYSDEISQLILLIGLISVIVHLTSVNLQKKTLKNLVFKSTFTDN